MEDEGGFETGEAGSSTSGAVDEGASSSSSSGAEDDEGSSSGDGPIEPPAPAEAWRTSVGFGHATALCTFDDGRIAVATSRATSLDPGAAHVSLLTPDGDELWTATFGEGGNHATVVHDLACGADGGLYGVGLQGDGDKWSLPRATRVRIDVETGTVDWFFIEPEVPSSEGLALALDANGFYVVGADSEGGLLWRYSTEGSEVWRRSPSGVRRLHDVLLHDGTLYAVGATDGYGPENAGVLLTYSPDGSARWTEVLNFGDRVTGDMLAVDPEGTVLAVGRLRQGGDEPVWVLACDDAGCDSDPALGVDDERNLHGFVVDPQGRWLINGRRDLRGRFPDERDGWILETDFDWSYAGERRKMLALGPQGSIVVAGGSPAEVLKLDPLVR